MKLTYLFHSGFKLETDDKIIIFDYFKDNCCKARDKSAGHCHDTLGSDKNLYFFVSHAHYDHYDKEIFKFSKTKQYFLYEEFENHKDLKHLEMTDKITFCKAYDEFQFDDMKISTFGSTDEGLSFWVEVDGNRIFHAGDLNWWHWNGESEDEQEYAKTLFFNELNKIKGKTIDIAMFPVDPRLEDAYSLGGKTFIETIQPKIFIPMHFLDCYDITVKFNSLMSDNIYSKVVTLSKRGEEIDIR